jgi:hypothetical protein
MTLFWRGKHRTSNDLLAFPVDGELDSISDADFDIYTVSLPPPMLLDCADQVGGSRAQRLLFREEALRLTPESMARLRTLVGTAHRALTSASAAAGKLLPLPKPSELGEIIVGALLTSSANSSQASRSAAPRPG